MAGGSGLASAAVIFGISMNAAQTSNSHRNDNIVFMWHAQFQWLARDCKLNFRLGSSLAPFQCKFMAGLIAIVGRPHVGKPALFNRMAGRRIAIVHDQPGVTRDRVTAEVEWRGRLFTLIDTGGIGLLRGEKALDVITRAAIEQVDLAIQSADAIILVVNVQEGVVALDREVAEHLRRSGKPVIVAVNKVDTAAVTPQVDEFTALGFDKLAPVTAIHGEGIEALVDAATIHLPPESEVGASDEKSTPPLKLAIVGRPNVGKS